MSMDLYDQVFVFLDGQLLGEATKVDTSLEGDDQDVMTLAKGFAGQSPSPKKRVTSIDSMVLTTGFEFDYETKLLTSQKVELGLQFGGSGDKVLSKGFLRNVKVSAGVGQAVTVSFEHHGEPSAFS